MKTSVAIIGYGEIGMAIDSILSLKSDCVVERWDKDASRVPNQKSLEEVASNADVVFLGVQSWIVRAALKDIGDFLKKDAIVVSFAKGIEKENSKTMDEVMSEALPRGQQFALCLGPMLADELKNGLAGAAVIATREQSTFDRLQQLFNGTPLLVEYSSDVRGVALAGVLKNTYAIFLGICDALGVGQNMKGYFTAKALSEMRIILPRLGGREETVDGVGCLADFIATAYSAYSRNRRFGEEIVRHGASDVKGEGIASFEPLVSLIGERRESLPIFSALYAILIQKQDAQTVIATLTRS